MGELTGMITFINSHDYVSDITGDTVRGCLAVIKHDSGNTSLYTTSERLQGTLEMAYAAKPRVTVSFWDNQPDFSKTVTEAFAEFRLAEADNEGPFAVKAIWTRK
ncbi:MAG: hypothetical protein ABI163_15510 [Thermoanaerobaculia bacterium]